MKVICFLIVILNIQYILSSMRHIENEKTIQDLESRIEQLEKGD